MNQTHSIDRGDDLIVGTAYGSVRGVEQDGVTAFLGVPYGARTSGAARFVPPAAPDPWDTVRDAGGLGPRCPQMPAPRPDGLAMFGEPSEEPAGEDCLVLNVWTPAADRAARPVLVYCRGDARFRRASHHRRRRP